MSFDKKKFSPVHVNAGPHSPRIFSYCNMNDLLSEIMEPGYFKKLHLIMRANSFVKVICKDAIVELVVDSNINQIVILKNEFLRFTDPYKEDQMIPPQNQISPRHPASKGLWNIFQHLKA